MRDNPKVGEYVAWTMRDGNIMAGKVTGVAFGTASVTRVDGGSVRIDVSKLHKASLDERDNAVKFFTRSNPPKAHMIPPISKWNTYHDSNCAHKGKSSYDYYPKDAPHKNVKFQLDPISRNGRCLSGYTLRSFAVPLHRAWVDHGTVRSPAQGAALARKIYARENGTSSNPRRTRINPTFYKTFKRSANSLDQLVHARKITVDTGITEAEARAQCQAFNANRTPAQIRKGLKMEYTAMSSRGNPKRRTKRRTKRNAPMARAKKIKTGMVVGIAAAAAAVWYFFLRGKNTALANPLPIVALRDPSRPVGSTGQSYPDREQNRANAVEAAKYLKPGISDAKAKEIADAMMRSGLMRSYAQRVLSVSEWTNLQPMRNVVENLTK